jgi:hypothetical protein
LATAFTAPFSIELGAATENSRAFQFAFFQFFFSTPGRRSA